MSTKEPMVAVITGANRGLGFEVARQLIQAGYQVVLGCRDYIKCCQAEQSLIDIGQWRPCALPLDVIDDYKVKLFRDEVLNRFGRVNVLINNAAIYLDNSIYGYNKPVAEGDAADFLHTLDVNVIGAFRMIKAFLPTMQAQNYGRIVNVSSVMGQVREINAYAAFYSISKASLNGLTLAVAHQCVGVNVLINSVCPGWVRTGMGGNNGGRNVEEGARGIIWAATLPDGGPSGKFYRDSQELDWCGKDQ